MDEQKNSPENVLGLVGAIGTDLERVEVALAGSLSELSYQTERIKLSKLMKGLPVLPWKELLDSPEFERYDRAMSGETTFVNCSKEEIVVHPCRTGHRS